MIARIAVFLFWATSASAQTLDFPSNGRLQAEVVSPADSYELPLGIWDRGEMPTRSVEGRKTQQAWRIAAPTLTVLQLARPLREQLQNDGYDVIFECQTEACGGFDFRFAVETLRPPEMRINIGDFRFLAAEKPGPDGAEYLTLFLSRTAEAGFVQITHIGPLDADEKQPPLATARPEVDTAGTDIVDGLAGALETDGRAVLEDLAFATGSAQLGEGSFVSLTELANYLRANPTLTIALVGHTDSSGSLEANIALSKRRAASVLERLVTVYDIPRSQMEAEGMGYLSPVASNLTEAGREANRRVEVIMTATSE